MTRVSRRKAVKVAAEEIRLQRFKLDIWAQAKVLARSKGTRQRLEYARLRCQEILRNPQARACDQEEIIAALNRRQRQFLWEAGMLLVGLIALLVVSLHGLS
ncbi:hypothetical protein HBA55_17305 [Pseudomaricurvus alkylphenolicus]|uniref:hypothetical protein n=1 Tax=Pseudomaricurvus alkylphenolicus TaxID=1306991 RepID=UPI00141F359C|nr:hypothetical protein [Pseudomaricurvus alkylphenolicus]NIB41364.1 hypothetical protein [Pseudomaricurvus alkylphenolicus]